MSGAEGPAPSPPAREPLGGTPWAFGTYEDAKAMVGDPPMVRTGHLDIDIGLIRLFCGVIEDSNRSYWDAEFAHRTWNSQVSPPGLLMSWAFQLPWAPQTTLRDPMLPLQVPLPGDQVIHSRHASEFYEPLRVGDRITVAEHLAEVSDLKTTRLGRGHFVTTQGSAYGREQRLLATLRNVLFRYQAHEPAEIMVVRPSSTEPDRKGAKLPTVSFRPTISGIMLTMGATLDAYPGHHDLDHSRSNGHPTLFLNTMEALGLVDRAVTDWAGAETFILRHEISINNSVYADTSVEVRGVVTDFRPGGSQQWGHRPEVEVDVSVVGDDIVCVRGSVAAVLPAGTTLPT